MAKKRFSGKLAEPIKIRTRRPTLLTSGPEWEAEIDVHNKNEYRRAFVEQMNKLPDLFAEFDIVPTNDATLNFARLALALAWAFVPGFRIKDISYSRERGRQRKWDPIKYCELIADVETLKQEKKRSDSEACNVLAKSSRFADRWGGYSKRTLENRLIKARDTNENILYRLRGRPDHPNQIPDDVFNAMIRETFALTKNA